MLVLVPVVIEAKSSRKSSLPPPPLEETVNIRVFVSVPAEFVAEIVTVEVPAVNGVPEMSPVAVSTKRFAGNPVAPKEVGLLVAVMV